MTYITEYLLILKRSVCMKLKDISLLGTSKLRFTGFVSAPVAIRRLSGANISHRAEQYLVVALLKRTRLSMACLVRQSTGLGYICEQDSVAKSHISSNIMAIQDNQIVGIASYSFTKIWVKSLAQNMSLTELTLSYLIAKRIVAGLLGLSKCKTLAATTNNLANNWW